MSINFQPGYPSKKPPTLDVGRIASVSGQVGLAIIGIILVSLLVGLGIDKLLQTEKHPFTAIFFLGSVPISLAVTYWLARRATKDLNTHQPAGKPGTPVAEDDEHE